MEKIMQINWDLENAFAVPEVFRSNSPVSPDPRIQPIFFRNVNYNGKETRTFAWLGIPENKSGEKVPGMVLVHGGGGTAFWKWVKIWCERGYAAIAMDTCGAVGFVEDLGKRPHKHHQYSGPNGCGRFDEQNLPPHDQWCYHAVQAVMRAHSLLRSQKMVDENRTGITGISWGGFLACIAAGLDKRFRFAIPVYGCGYLNDDSVWKYTETRNGNYDTWFSLWDPRHYLKLCKTPFCWVNGTNDFAFFMPSHQKSYRTTNGKRTLVIHHEMVHGHEAGGLGDIPEEISVYANSVVRNGVPLPNITSQNVDWQKRELCLSYESQSEITSAEILFTRATGYWPDRRWNCLSACVDTSSCKVSAAIDNDAIACFINIYDSRGLTVSSEMKIFEE